MKIAIVVPAHIPPTQDWIWALEREARVANADVIIVDDSDGKLGEMPEKFRVYGYDKQKEFLGDLYDEFATMFHKSSACRVFGHVVAYAEGYDVVIGLDSDCVVPFYFVQKHITMLNSKKGRGWVNPLGSSGFYTRGYPYSMRDWKVSANMGMWDNVLDINGKDRKPDEPKRVNIDGYNVSPGIIPFSGMNFALTRDVLLGFLFLPNFEWGDDKFRRIDDIWGGYIFQKLLAKMSRSVTFGQPIVYHDTVVVPEEDAAEEEAMYKHEDEFIKDVDDATYWMALVIHDKTSMKDVMVDFIGAWILHSGHTTFESLTPAFKWWEKVINKYGN